jgi:hypothetical protein
VLGQGVDGQERRLLAVAQLIGAQARSSNHPLWLVEALMHLAEVRSGYRQMPGKDHSPRWLVAKPTMTY